MRPTIIAGLIAFAACSPAKEQQIAQCKIDAYNHDLRDNYRRDLYDPDIFRSYVSSCMQSNGYQKEPFCLNAIEPFCFYSNSEAIIRLAIAWVKY